MFVYGPNGPHVMWVGILMWSGVLIKILGMKS